MTGDELGRLAYLVLLGAAVAGYAIVANRGNMSRLVRQAALWAFIFIGVIVAIGLWDDIRRTTLPGVARVEKDGTLRVPRARDGHFYLRVELDGTPVTFMVDTGATDIVLGLGTARRLGVDVDALPFYGSAQTANGPVRTAPVRISEMRIGPFVDRDVTVWVADGDMEGALLGMAYLRRFSRVEIRGDTLVLSR